MKINLVLTKLSRPPEDDKKKKDVKKKLAKLAGNLVRNGDYSLDDNYLKGWNLIESTSLKCAKQIYLFHRLLSPFGHTYV